MGFELNLKVSGGLPKIKNPFKSVSKASIPLDGQGIDNYEELVLELVGGKAVFTKYSSKKVVDWYAECPPLPIILNKKALAFNNGIIKLVSPDNIKKEYQSTGRLKKLLELPNPLLTGKQFRVQIKTIYELFGFCAVLRIKPEMFKIQDFNQAWILPNQYLNITWNNRYIGVTSISDMIDKIEFGTDGNRTELPKEDIYFFTDLTTGLEASPFPQSRIDGIKYAIQNVINTYHTKGFVIKHRGAQGILSNVGKDAMGQKQPLDKPEVDRIQRDYKKNYGLSGDQWQLIITNQALEYQSMGFTPKDLMLQEFMEDDIKTMCNAFGIPYLLLSEGSNSTFSNQGEAKKSFYQDTIVPESDNFTEQWNDFTYAFKSDRKHIITFDHLDVLQKDKKAEAETKKAQYQVYLGMFISCSITHGRFVELMEEQDAKAEWANKYFIDLPPEYQAVFINQKKEGGNNVAVN